MPKISKKKVEPPIVLEDAEKDADQSMPPPPPRSPPSKPSPGRAAPMSPGRKQVAGAKSAVKEAKREYLALKRAATKLGKVHEHRHTLLLRHEASVERTWKKTKPSQVWRKIYQLSNAEIRSLLALSQYLAAGLAASHGYQRVQACLLHVKCVENDSLRRRLKRARVTGR